MTPSETTFDLLTLYLLSGITPRTIRLLSTRCAIREVLVHPREHSDLLPPHGLAAIEGGTARNAAEREVATAARSATAIFGIDDECYPSLLRPAHDPPPVLYVRGNLEQRESDRAVAIVGARAATPSGRAFARRLARDLAISGATVVSGLARGIDAEAHGGALDGGGRTIAVLGSGLDRIYPPEHQALAAAVAHNGALVSEFPMATPPHAGHFPRRNRILATWGRGVVVVEASQRSGALVTARLALDEGREVLAVPGHPTQALAAGTNGLLRDGAVLVRDANDVREALDLPAATAPPEAPPADSFLSLLDPVAPRSPESLALASALAPGPLLAKLMQLELDGQIRRLPGPLFVRSA